MTAVVRERGPLLVLGIMEELVIYILINAYQIDTLIHGYY